MTSEKLIRNLIKQGFELVSHHKHTKLRSPDGQLLIVPTTIGGGRGLKNTAAQVARLGYSLAPTKVGGRPGKP